MRRYAFYFSVALLVFGVGTYFVYLSPLRKADVMSEPVFLVEKDTVKTISIDENKTTKRKTEYLSDKEKSELLFQPTLNKWLNNKKIENVVKPSKEIIEKIDNSKLNMKLSHK